ncbi:carbon-nitrogen family hydrolase [Brevibacillus sp. SYP-B805]|uniref:carbon-nitrogen family hydrolase n=1 Tax=Brevibacillus sp. SYP-B805 TaxID=1578199 RepID=UPI0013EB6FB1|nr:carbon-nitrogen family hydrolase [Brevibacillus sp. SYP-B805]NGQ97478.1 carbon-nitrogen family hydrolase [Brevibacillus sp. SYP-B805]
MKQKWNVALLQMDVAFGQPEQNREKVRQMVERLEGKETDLLLLPELWDTAYDLERLDEIADDSGAQAKALLSETARRLNSFVVGGSIAERIGNKVYNTSYVFDRSGALIGRYSKAHLFRLMEEEKYLTAGDEVGIYTMDGQPTGSMICYDIRFPEWFRTYALHGVKALFVCAQWPHPRLNHWRQLLIARAIENQMYVVACNRVGDGGNNTFCGHSMVINPWGEIVAEAMQQEEIVTGEIDFALVDEVRGRIPVFADRRPGLYRMA